jgi:hypothetical protein
MKGDTMKFTFFLGIVALSVSFLNCAKEAVIQTESPIYQSAELILEIDASYDYDNLSGHRFICPVKRIIKGLIERKTIMLEISLDPSAKETYGDYLKPYQEYEALVVGFNHIAEVPAHISGFKDDKGRYWEIVFVAKMANLPRD